MYSHMYDLKFPDYLNFFLSNNFLVFAAFSVDTLVSGVNH